jgi:hypothetical protein
MTQSVGNGSMTHTYWWCGNDTIDGGAGADDTRMVVLVQITYFWWCW